MLSSSSSSAMVRLFGVEIIYHMGQHRYFSFFQRLSEHLMCLYSSLLRLLQSRVLLSVSNKSKQMTKIVNIRQTFTDSIHARSVFCQCGHICNTRTQTAGTTIIPSESVVRNIIGVVSPYYRMRIGKKTILNIWQCLSCMVED